MAVRAADDQPRTLSAFGVEPDDFRTVHPHGQSVESTAGGKKAFCPRQRAGSKLRSRLQGFAAILFKDKHSLFLRSKTNTKPHAASEQLSRRGPGKSLGGSDATAAQDFTAQSFLWGGCLDSSGSAATATIGAADWSGGNAGASRSGAQQPQRGGRRHGVRHEPGAGGGARSFCKRGGGLWPVAGASGTRAGGAACDEGAPRPRAAAGWDARDEPDL